MGLFMSLLFEVFFGVVEMCKTGEGEAGGVVRHLRSWGNAVIFTDVKDMESYC